MPDTNIDKNALFAKNIEALRLYKGQSISELAEEIGVPKSTLQSVRTNGHTTLDTAIRIADGLHLPLDSLTGDDRLTDKLDIIQFVLQGAERFRTLSAGEQEEALRCFRKIVELFCR